MSDVMTHSAPPADAEDETTLKQILAEIDCLNGQMALDRKDIERLKAESAQLKVETRAILATLGASV